MQVGDPALVGVGSPLLFCSRGTNRAWARGDLEEHIRNGRTKSDRPRPT